MEWETLSRDWFHSRLCYWCFLDAILLATFVPSLTTELAFRKMGSENFGSILIPFIMNVIKWEEQHVNRERAHECWVGWRVGAGGVDGAVGGAWRHFLLWRIYKDRKGILSWRHEGIHAGQGCLLDCIRLSQNTLLIEFWLRPCYNVNTGVQNAGGQAYKSK